jgi:tRNA pseudouridine synthase A
MKFLIKFAYDGTNFSGFQYQPGKRTIEEELNKVLTKINNNHKTTIVATGRTDAKVHALSQYAHVNLDVNITEYKLKRAMNSYLDDDIHVLEVKKVDDSFHARYNVLSKTYKYYINLGEYNPTRRNYELQYNHILNIEKMKEAIKVFLGEHDYRAFVTQNKEKDNCIRTITKAEIEEKNNILIITFTGDGFLRYQVRNMVGILIRIGENKLTKEQLSEILLSCDRTKSGKTAPACGLYLEKVDFRY